MVRRSKFMQKIFQSASKKKEFLNESFSFPYLIEMTKDFKDILSLYRANFFTQITEFLNKTMIKEINNNNFNNLL